MKRKQFIKTSSTLMVGGLLLPVVQSCKPKDKVIRKNWAGNYTYKAENFHEPESVEKLQSLVAKLGQQKALGSKHCFNNIADSPLNQISTKKLNRVISIDEVNQRVTVQGGVRYGDLAPELHQKGFALHNLASLPHISIPGACATATHGSGVKNGNLSTSVQAIELVTANGELLKLNKNDPEFNGAIVNLGALGIIVQATLEIQKTFNVRQDVFQDLPLQSIQNSFEEIMAYGYSVSLFTDWQNESISQVWIKRRTDQEVEEIGNDFFGAHAAQKDLHPITAVSAENCTKQMGEPGPWHERLPHFKMGFTPSSGDELQSEYFIPRAYAKEAFMKLVEMKDIIYPELLISEIRSIAADDFWLSPAYKKDCISFHFTWKPNWEGVKEILPQIEDALSSFGVMPHWGKMFTLDPKTIRSRYEKMPDFLKLIQKYDPEGKFRNAYLDLNLFS